MEILISHEEGINSQLPVKIQTNKTQKQRWPARSAFPLNLRWQEPSVEQHAKFTVWLYFSKKLFKHEGHPFLPGSRSSRLELCFWLPHLSALCTLMLHFLHQRKQNYSCQSIISSAIQPWFLTHYNSCSSFWMVSKLVNVTGQDRLRLLQIRLLRSLISSLNSARKG